MKWGRGAKCIGGKIEVGSWERALKLTRRGYIVTADPSNEATRAGFRDGATRRFERHSRPGFVDEEGLMRKIERLAKAKDPC